MVGPVKKIKPKVKVKPKVKPKVKVKVKPKVKVEPKVKVKPRGKVVIEAQKEDTDDKYSKQLHQLISKIKNHHLDTDNGIRFGWKNN